MTTASLGETFADVSALIPRYSWEIMDEEQRDDLMAKVVLPRYMQTTADGVQLGPTAWAEMVGATMSAVESRVRRLKISQKGGVDESAPAHWTADGRVQRSARGVLRHAPPEQIAELLDSPEVRQNVRKAEAIVYDKINARSKQAYREAIGPDVADNLEYSQELQDLEHELVKARGALAGFLRHAAALEGDRPEGWVNECNAWLDDITYKVEMARGLLRGDNLADELDKLLAGEA